MKYLNFILTGLLIVMLSGCNKEGDNFPLDGGVDRLCCECTFIKQLDSHTFECTTLYPYDSFSAYPCDLRQIYLGCDEEMKNKWVNENEVLSMYNDVPLCTITRTGENCYIIKISEKAHEWFCQFYVSWWEGDTWPSVAGWSYENNEWDYGTDYYSWDLYQDFFPQEE